MRAGGRASGCESRGISLCHCPSWYITALTIQHLGNVRMTIDPDRKTYWDLFETLTCIDTRMNDVQQPSGTAAIKKKWRWRFGG
jgi:hypothetical protein